jgi:hypothetical protein
MGVGFVSTDLGGFLLVPAGGMWKGEMVQRSAMIRKLLSMFGGKKAAPAPEVDEEMIELWAVEKDRLMERILGKEHDMVMHALIPYAAGGALDLYYYPNEIEGVGIATKELSVSPAEGSGNDVFGLYELVMFTRHALDMEAANNPETAFGRAHANIRSVLNVIAPYSAQAKLNPRETCEFPQEMEGVGGKCFIFDAYGMPAAGGGFGMLLVLEVFRPEMEFAREHGGRELLQRLQDAGHYPYSDLERDPVA